MDKATPIIIQSATFSTREATILSSALLVALSLLGGVFLGRLGAENRRQAADRGREEVLRREIRDLTREIQRFTGEKERKNEIALQIPTLVRTLSGKKNPEAIPTITVRLVKEFFRASRVGFFAADEDLNDLLYVAGVGFPQEWKGNRRFPACEGMMGDAVQNRVLVTKEDYLGGRPINPTTPASIENTVVGIDVIAPVVDFGRVRGAIVIAGSPLSLDEERAYVSMLADLAANASRNAIDVQAAEHSASVDALTGVSNRACFTKRFEADMRQAKNYLTALSIAIVDIDHFKKVNDAHGHTAGDAVLREFVGIFRQFTRSADMVARYGGEEFVLLLAANKEQTLIHVENLRLRIEGTEFRVPGAPEPLRVTFSAGIASFPEDGDGTSGLIEAADRALYEAKTAGRNRIVCARPLGIDGNPLRGAE